MAKTELDDKTEAATLERRRLMAQLILSGRCPIDGASLSQPLAADERISHRVAGWYVRGSRICTECHVGWKAWQDTSNNWCIGEIG